MYRQLTSFISQKKLQNIMKQKGGKCFGEGTYGRVCSSYEMFNDATKFDKMPIITVFTFDYKTNTIHQQDMRIVDFVILYNDKVVFKEMKSPMEINTEINNMKIVADIENNVLYKHENGDVFLYFTYKTGTGVLTYPLYKRMKGDMFSFLEHEKKYINQFILSKAKDTVELFIEELHAKNYFHNDIKSANILYNVSEKGEYEFAVGDYGLLTPDKPQLGTIETPWRTTFDKLYNDYNAYYSTKFQNFTKDAILAIFNEWNKYSGKSYNVYWEDYYAIHITFKHLFNYCGYPYHDEVLLFHPYEYLNHAYDNYYANQKNNNEWDTQENTYVSYVKALKHLYQLKKTDAIRHIMPFTDTKVEGHYVFDSTKFSGNDQAILAPLHGISYVEIEEELQNISKQFHGYGGRNVIHHTKVTILKTKKQYVVREDNKGKYILQNKHKVYLTSIKGTYRYQKP